MIIDKEKYIVNLQDKEKAITIRRLLDKIEIVLNRHTLQTTDFLDPYERRLARSILNQFRDIDYSEIGGLEDAERKIILIYPDYYVLGADDIDLNYLHIYDYAGAFDHRDFLGSILSLGIIREKIGDILIHSDYGQIVVKREISDFILINLHKIGRENVKVKEISSHDLAPMDIEYEERITTVSSLRLDGVLSSVLNLSRNESQKLVQMEYVKVNWEKITRSHWEIEGKDMVSVRGHGRFIVSEILGKTRKGRLRICAKLLK